MFDRVDAFDRASATPGTCRGSALREGAECVLVRRVDCLPSPEELDHFLRVVFRRVRVENRVGLGPELDC
jgi:hypothetical protein